MPASTALRSDQLQALCFELEALRARGLHPSLTDYQSRHPEFADELAEFFEGTMRIKGPSERWGPQGDAAPELPAFIGEYRIVRELGRGGMGVVYEAEQMALRRRVALKVLPPQWCQDSVALARFRREARAAALLHHTNIVPVFEVGCADGVWFYAMQHIAGESLDKVLERVRREPSLDEPLAPKHAAFFRTVAQLGQQVAQALAYAHSRGIVHRDIKPSNLLIDPEGLVWVADFGLAKQKGDDLTQAGDVMGTLRYLAPERLRGEGDHRADIYALGLTLYEALVQAPAYPANDLRVVEQMQSREPARPRSVNPAIPLDLETIVLKAMEKDPSQRYQSAEVLAEDLRRFLADEPIQARRVSVVEKIRRAARRNPGLARLTIAVVFLTLILVAGAIAAAFSFSQLANQERIQTTLAEKARMQAEIEKDRANEVSTFLLGLLEEADPLGLTGRGLGQRKIGAHRLTPRQMLDQAAAKLANSLHDSPTVRASLLDKIGTVYVSYSQFDKAKTHLDEALRLRQEHCPADSAELADTWQHVGYYHHARFQIAAAEAAYRKALHGREKALGANHPFVAETLIHLGFLLALEPDGNEAETMLTRALELQRGHFGDKSREYGMALAALIHCHLHRREIGKALPLLAQGEAIAKQFQSSEDSDAGKVLQATTKGILAHRLGLHAHAASCFREAREHGAAWLGDDHFFLLLGRKYLASILHEDLRDLPGAEAEYRFLIDRMKTVTGEDSEQIGSLMMYLGRVLRDQKRWDEAEKTLRDGAANLRRHESDSLGRCMHILGEVLTKSGQHAAAVPVLAEAAELRCRSGDKLWGGFALDGYVAALVRVKKPTEAADALRTHLPALQRNGKADADFHFHQACRYCRLAQLTPHDAERTAAADQALAALRAAVAAGHRDPQKLRDPRLQPLQDRDDFKRLLRDLQPGS